MKKEFYSLTLTYREGYFDGDYWIPDVPYWEDAESEFVGYCKDLFTAQQIAKRMIAAHRQIESCDLEFFKENERHAYYRYRLLRKDGRRMKRGFEYRYDFIVNSFIEL